MSAREKLSPEQAFQHGHLLTTTQNDYRKSVISLLTSQIKEDVRSTDLTSTFLFPFPKISAKGEITAKQDGVMAGLEELQLLCSIRKINMIQHVKDGSLLKSGEKVAELSGAVQQLLETERVGLDLIGRMSGIATRTAELVAKVKKISQVCLSATRKTLWGLLDKKAVYLGGGLTHRLGLWHAILIKENHLIALKNSGVDDPFEEAIARLIPTLSKTLPAFVEIEVESVKDAAHVAPLLVQQLGKFQNLPSAILLDNFRPETIIQTVGNLTQNGWREKILLEASGGITAENLEAFAATKVDLISIGSITHSAKNFDFSMRVVSNG